MARVGLGVHHSVGKSDRAAQLQQVFPQPATKAKLPKIKVHDARRVCASLLADLDVHPRVAMAILRHADFKVTMEIYTEASSKATKAALKRLGKSLEF